MEGAGLSPGFEKRRWSMIRPVRFPFFLILSIAAFFSPALEAPCQSPGCPVFPSSAPEAKNRLTVVNGTESPALVKIRDASGDSSVSAFEISGGADHTVMLADGKYREYVRFGKDSLDFRYAKGEGFDLSSPSDGYIEARLTLHCVLAGNYNQVDCSREEFEKN
jgi:hypothetical protein